MPQLKLNLSCGIFYGRVFYDKKNERLQAHFIF